MDVRSLYFRVMSHLSTSTKVTAQKTRVTTKVSQANLDADLATTSCPILEDDPAVCQGVLEVAPVQ